MKQFRLVITRSKQTNTKKDAISRAINNNKQTSTPEGSLHPVDNIFGMRPIDYTIRPPICNSPPPPPPRPGMRKYIFPMSLVVFAAITGYFYVNNKNDNIEFWLAMQNGEAVDVDGDDDEDEDEGE
ncbi:hypothetical protein ACHAXN_003412 [Cyclotella atomus]|jgi:hypothetical protein